MSGVRSFQTNDRAREVTNNHCPSFFFPARSAVTVAAAVAAVVILALVHCRGRVGRLARALLSNMLCYPWMTDAGGAGRNGDGDSGSALHSTHHAPSNVAALQSPPPSPLSSSVALQLFSSTRREEKRRKRRGGRGGTSSSSSPSRPPVADTAAISFSLLSSSLPFSSFSSLPLDWRRRSVGRLAQGGR